LPEKVQDEIPDRIHSYRSEKRGFFI
jgi:hypothetical protein